MTKWRDRWVRTEYVRVDQLMANPLNWRVHPKVQQDTLLEAIGEVGFLAAVEINETTGNMLDGHLRAQLAELDGETVLRADIYDLDEEEEAKYLVTKDPISAMAVTDQQKLAEALAQIASAGPAIQALAGNLMASDGIDGRSSFDEPPPAEKPEADNAEENVSPDTRGELLEKLNAVSIGEPRYEVHDGEVYVLSGPQQSHTLIVIDVFTGWPLFTPYLTDEHCLLLPYPGPLAPLTEGASQKRFVMVQPDHYLAGWILHRWSEVHGEQTITKKGESAASTPARGDVE